MAVSCRFENAFLNPFRYGLLPDPILRSTTTLASARRQRS